MKTIKVETSKDIPNDFTGIAEYSNGDREWYKEGKLHREVGPAVEYPIGTKLWFKEGKRHRLDGPAVEWVNGYKEWWIEGLRHRIDGPAVEYSHGEKEYYINGEALQTSIFIYGKIFLGKEKGKYGLEWLRFLDEDGIEEYPIVPGHEYEFVEIKHFTLEELLNRKM